MPSKKRATPVSLQPLDALFGTNEETTNGISEIAIGSLHPFTNHPFQVRDVKDYEDEEEIASYLSKILKKEAFDQKGLIYGMGHAVYSISDPRERVFKGFVEQLARDKGREKDMTLYNNIEKIAPKLIAKQRQIFKGVSPNIDFYSGFVYDMLNIPRELYTPLFAIARIAGWSAHRLEELITTDKIIRPAYKSLVSKKEYIEREER